MVRSGATQYAMVFIGLGAGVCGVGFCAIGTSLIIQASFSDMSILLALVTSDRFLHVFEDYDSGVCNKDSF